VAGAGFDRKKCDGLSMERRGNTRQSNRMSDKTQAVGVEGGYCAYDECLRFVEVKNG
jgi:hypothetical protein